MEFLSEYRWSRHKFTFAHPSKQGRRCAQKPALLIPSNLPAFLKDKAIYGKYFLGGLVCAQVNYAEYIFKAEQAES
jgi:hypothetical protein